MRVIVNGLLALRRRTGIGSYVANLLDGLHRVAGPEVVNELGLPPDRVTAVPLGVRPDLRPLPLDVCRPVLQRLSLAPGYLLHVGTIEPRKNILTLLRAYCALPVVLRDRCPLVLAGG